MGEQTLEFELLTCINMLNNKNKKIVIDYINIIEWGI